MLDTSQDQADAIVQQIAAQKHLWVQVSLPDRITYLKQCIQGMAAVAEPWVAANCQAKGIVLGSQLEGDEWFAGLLPVVAYLQNLVKSLEQSGQPRPIRWREHNGQAIAQVFPDNRLDTLLWTGYQGEVWLEPGKPATQASAYRQPQGRLALVLGAGNQAAIPPLDSLYKLFVENQVVILKMNPVNAYLGPLLLQAFQVLHRDVFFAVVYGGAELGEFLCQHSLVDTLHITGSHRTYDAIVWGHTPAEQADRKHRQQPLNPKPITAELGCVTPVIVVPGQWSKDELAYQARHVASMVVNNASFNCVAAKVVITAAGWAQRQAFLHALRQELAIAPARVAYYPGAEQRYQAFLDRYPQAQVVGDCTDTTVPWTIFPDVPAQAGEYALSAEAFCGVLAEVSLEATEPGEFLRQAVAFVNQQVWGTLSCTMLIDPRTQQQLHLEMEQAIADLRYGTIGINVWGGVIFGLPALTWGAFPGHPASNIESGQGVVHNRYLFDYPQKSVLRSPFRQLTTPVWFTRHANLRLVARQFFQLMLDPNPINLTKVVIASLKS